MKTSRVAMVACYLFFSFVTAGEKIAIVTKIIGNAEYVR